MLVSHFLLDLQEAHQKTLAGRATNDPSNISNLFDALESIGASLDVATNHVEEEDNQGDNDLQVSKDLHLDSTIHEAARI